MSKTVTALYISLVIPAYNEEENILLLYERIKLIMETMKRGYEIIFVDDGSKDNTVGLLRQIKMSDNNVKIIKLRRNFGQTAAMSAGFDYAQGDIIIPLDADLQNDPQDIPRLVEKIEAGYDIVSGWRKNRQDKTFSRKIPSMIANKIISWITGVHIHDYGCTLKAYRSSVIKSMHLYSDMHRFLPAMGLLTGARIVEIPVTHHPRRFGASKYGINRIGKVIIDILTIKLVTRFSSRPMYFFGYFAIMVLVLAVFFTILSIRYYLLNGMDMFFNISLPTAGILVWGLAAYLISMGFLCEHIIIISKGRSVKLQRALAEYKGLKVANE